MRRYLYSGSFSALPSHNYDVVIIGSGIAGLYAALHIDASLRVALVTKENLKKSNSYYVLPPYCLPQIILSRILKIP